MSAEDTYILINEKTFEIYKGSMSTNHLKKVGKGRTLKDAIVRAEEYEEKLLDRGICLEYGFFFSKHTKGYEVKC